MTFLNKIAHRINYILNKKFICVDYPMLTYVSRFQLRKQGAIGLVYMLHHIVDKDIQRLPPNEDLKISPLFLDRIIRKYQNRDFEFITLDKLYDIIFNHNTIDKPFIAFTIDDGYEDNYKNALPVFEKYNVPFAIFVATDFIDRKAILWWNTIENLILSNESITTNDGAVYQCRTYQQKWDTFRCLREKILTLNQKSLIVELKEMFKNYEINWFEPIDKSAMTWEQIKEISNNPLCTIGGHTVSHPALNRLTEEEFYHEISDGVKKIEGITGKKIIHFAYPYGSENEIGEREIFLISKLGLYTAFRSFGGCIMANTKYNKYNLPRIYLHEK